MLACDSHHPDSNVFLSTHSLFVHQKEFQLSLLPLHLLLQKLQGLARSSLKQYFDIMLREFHILGLMYSVLSELPKSDRILDSEDVLLDEAGILRWMTELEVSMSSLRDLTEQTPATIVQTLISRGQFVLCRRLVEVLRFDGEMVASTLAKWVADQLRSARPEKLEKLEVPIRRNGETYAKGCADLLRIDPTGKLAVSFTHALLAENPAATLPPFVDRVLEELMESGSCAYSAVVGELLGLGRLEEACRLLCAAMERRSVWVSPSLVERVKCCFAKVEASEKLSESMKRRVKCRDDGME